MKEYIERNDLIRELEDDLANDINMYNSHIDKEIRDDKIYFACDVLASAPAADVREVVHAKWVIAVDDFEDGRGEVETPHCTNCGTGVYRHDALNYCPYCGAKMSR